LSAREGRAFPVGFETAIILDNVKNDDRVVYLNSCACFPLYRELLRVVAEESIRTTSGVHESVNVENDWATLLIGQCILDEFADVSKAASETSRILKVGGTAILSGPVSRGDRLKFERSGKRPIAVPSLKEVEVELSRQGLKTLYIYNLTSEAKAELRRSGSSSSILDFDPSVSYVLVRAVKMLP
jgi:hypothetical protein